MLSFTLSSSKQAKPKIYGLEHGQVFVDVSTVANFEIPVWTMNKGWRRMDSIQVSRNNDRENAANEGG